MNHISQKDAQTTKDVISAIILTNLDPGEERDLVVNMIAYMDSIIASHKAYNPNFVANEAYDRAMKGIT